MNKLVPISACFFLVLVAVVQAQKGRTFVNAQRSPARIVQGGIKQRVRPAPQRPQFDNQAALSAGRGRPQGPIAAIGAVAARRPIPAAPLVATPVVPVIAAPAVPVIAAPAAPVIAAPAAPVIAAPIITAPVAPAVPVISAPAAPLIRVPAPRPQAALAAPVPVARARPAPRPSAALAAPARGNDDGDDGGPHPAPEPYNFSFAVNDEESGAQLTREERQDASGNVVGFYHILDAEGRRRRVDYTAGPEGFKAIISSNEEGLMNRDAADVAMTVEEVPEERQNAVAEAYRQAYRTRSRA